MTVIDHGVALAALAAVAWRAQSLSTHSPYLEGRQYYERTSNPRVGDLVCEGLELGSRSNQPDWPFDFREGRASEPALHKNPGLHIYSPVCTNIRDYVSEESSTSSATSTPNTFPKLYRH